MRKKILYILGDRSFGGGSHHVLDLVTNIDRKKFQPVLIVRQSIKSYFNTQSTRLYSLTMNKRFDLTAIRQIRQVIKQEKPNILHLHSTRAGILGTLAAKDLSIPIIYTEHLFTHDYVPQNRLIHWLQLQVLKYLFPYLTKVIAVSKAVRKYLIDKKVCPKEKIIVIYNGIEIKPKIKNQSSSRDQVEGRSKIKTNNRKIIIGSIGTLTPLKGYKYLILALTEVLQKLKKNGYKLLVEIVGEGFQRESLVRLCQKNDISQVKFLGQRDGIEKIMHNWDIYIQASLSESFGLGIAQAMSRGIPIIVTKVGGIPELVGKAGILVPKSNPYALSSAIIKLVRNKNLRVNLGQLGQKRIKQYFSQDTMIKQTGKLYVQTIKKYGAKR